MIPIASVIIPNWNGAAHLPVCLDALANQSFQNFELIVVDNASSDASLELIARHAPAARVLRLPRNVFFSGAVNAGIGIARGDYLVLLNNDTEAEPGWLGALVRALDADPEAGFTTSKLLLFDNRSVLHSAGDGYCPNGRPANRGVWQEDQGQFDELTEVFSACGAAAAYRRSMLEEIGLFDEDFIGYCEDIDLGFRAQLAGYRCVFVPEARVYHKISASDSGARSSRLCGQNFVNVLVKNMPGPLLVKHGLAIAREQLGITWHGLRQIRHRSGRGWLSGQLSALGQLPTMLAKRSRIQARRRIALKTLEARFS